MSDSLPTQPIVPAGELRAGDVLEPHGHTVRRVVDGRMRGTEPLVTIYVEDFPEPLVYSPDRECCLRRRAA